MDLFENIKDALDGITSELGELAAVCPAVTTTDCFPTAMKLLDEATALVQAQQVVEKKLGKLPPVSAGPADFHFGDYTSLDLIKLRLRIKEELRRRLIAI